MFQRGEQSICQLMCIWKSMLQVNVNQRNYKFCINIYIQHSLHIYIYTQHSLHIYKISADIVKLITIQVLMYLCMYLIMLCSYLQNSYDKSEYGVYITIYNVDN